MYSLIFSGPAFCSKLRTDMPYLYDPAIDDDLDAELRALLCLCFPGTMFERKRYNAELPAHRWILQDSFGRIVAHVAAHDKRIGLPDGETRAGGIAEVCVHPDHRGQGHVKRLMHEAHDWMRQENIPFSILVGEMRVYGSQGYRPATNPLRFFDVPVRRWVTRPCDYFLVLPLGGQAWPETGAVDLRGPLF
ncbi:MAG: GNAT family N-acetyltransferase [Opitutales bacterium]